MSPFNHTHVPCAFLWANPKIFFYGECVAVQSLYMHVLCVLSPQKQYKTVTSLCLRTISLPPHPNHQTQLSIAAALGRLLLDSSSPSASLSPLQLQLALGQVTLLLPSLGAAAGPALLSLRPPPSEKDSGGSALPAFPRRLLALCRHGSYGVRVEAAVALAGLVQVRTDKQTGKGERGRALALVEVGGICTCVCVCVCVCVYMRGEECTKGWTPLPPLDRPTHSTNAPQNPNHQALPPLAPAALAAAAAAVRAEYEALELLMVADGEGESESDDSDASSSSSSSSCEDEVEEEEEDGGGGSRAPSPVPAPDAAAAAASARRVVEGRRRRQPRRRVVGVVGGKQGGEGERRRRVCALHGCGAALALLLQGARVRVCVRACVCPCDDNSVMYLGLIFLFILKKCQQPNIASRRIK